LVKDSSAPAGWVYDGGFVLYQVKFFSNSFFGGFWMEYRARLLYIIRVDNNRKVIIVSDRWNC
jgi:hypothetical protein